MENVTVLADKHVWHKFDGKRLVHLSSSITKGEKWSLVAYHTNESLLAPQAKEGRAVAHQGALRPGPRREDPTPV